MRWFRRRSAEPPRPTATVPTPTRVDEEPAPKSTATATPAPAPGSAKPEPAIDTPPTVDEATPLILEMPRRRHWYPAGGEMRLPAARPPGAARPAVSRVGSGGWHRA